MARSYFGHIEYVSKGVYRIHWQAGRDADGKRRKRSKTVRGTRRAAEIALAAEAPNGGGPEGVTWRELWEAVVEPTLGGLADKTAFEYRRLWEREIEPVLGGMRLSDTNRKAAQAFLSGVESPSVQRACYRLVRKMANMAVAEELMPSCPVDRLTKLKPCRRRRKELVETCDVAWFMGLAAKSKYEAVLLFELGGGLRHEEACALEWEDVSFRDGHLSASVTKAVVMVGGRAVRKETKNQGSVREVVVGEPFASRLRAIGDGRKGRVSGPGAPSPASITQNWHRLCDRMGERYVRPSWLRSSFATIHGEAGTPDSVVAGIMGHSDGTTKGAHYQRVTALAQIEAQGRLAEHLFRFNPSLGIESPGETV